MRYLTRQQFARKHAKHRAGFVYVDDAVVHVPDLTIFEEEWSDTMQDCFTGLLGPNGEPIFCEPERQHFLGFLDPDREDAPYGKAEQSCQS